MQKRDAAVVVVVLCLALAGLVALHPGQPVSPPVGPGPFPPVRRPATPSITTPIPEYLPYLDLVKQLQQWHQQAPDLTELGTYGQSTAGKPLTYLLATNRLIKDAGKKLPVLLTSSIHGNEPLSTSTMMAVCGTLLSKYGLDPAITELLDTRDLYFVPVVSPDSYPNIRHVDGCDPNRDFPGPSRPGHVSVPPVKGIQDFFLKVKFRAVISGHTFGRILLTPFGDTNDLPTDNLRYEDVIGRMASLANYRKIHASEMYGSPIFGSEIDFFHRAGAFAIVMEFGTHQQIPTLQDTHTEFNRTFEAIKLFIREAPLSGQNY